MKKSKQLFTHYTTLWAQLLQQAANSNNPAIYLLTHDARTPLFYLEAMTRVLMHVHNPKKMRRLNEWFKALEDALGAMDYYTSLLKDFKSNRKIPVAFKREWAAHQTSATEHLNNLLIEVGWLGESADRLLTVHQYTKSMDWSNDKDLHRALKQRYTADLQSINSSLKRPIKEIERDIHELRRDVRWLSIYPQAFKGFITLHSTDKPAESLLKYATDDIIHSPFNQLPVIKDITKPLQLNTHAYYGMSWLIAQLGQLKDAGLRLLAVAELLQSEKKLSKSEARNTAQQLIGMQQISIDDLLNTARNLVTQAQQDKIFTQLM